MKEWCILFHHVLEFSPSQIERDRNYSLLLKVNCDVQVFDGFFFLFNFSQSLFTRFRLYISGTLLIYS